MTVDRDTVLASLRADDVANHLGIKGQWRGRWLRSSRCGATDHSSDAFGLARDGKWHCWACDKGGDLLSLIAYAEGIDVRAEFSRVLEIAAKIAGVTEEIDFGGVVTKAAPKARPPMPAIPALGERIAVARKRAAWVWARLFARQNLVRFVPMHYLAAERGIDPEAVLAREEIRETPIRVTRDEMERHPDLKSLGKSFSVPGIAIPVRSPIDGALVDIRVRRYSPREGQPKIVGMLGGVTTGPAEDGKARELVGCYGNPHAIDSDLVVVVEGAMDYLTALYVWPTAHVLGSVDAGSLALVANHAAKALAGRDDESRILIVEQNDGDSIMADGRVVAGPADRAVNEDTNAATKVAVRLLGPKRVGWLFCDGASGNPRAKESPGTYKDLNDLVRAKVDIYPRWWIDVTADFAQSIQGR